MRLDFSLSLSAKQCGNPYLGDLPVYQDLSIYHNWSVKEDIVDLPIRLKGKFSLRPFGAKNKDIGDALY